MDISDLRWRLLTSRATRPLWTCTQRLLYYRALRRRLVLLADGVARREALKDGRIPSAWRKIHGQRQLMALSVVYTIDRALERHVLSPHVARVILELWGRALLSPPGAGPVRQRFRAAYGCNPPWFVVIAPGRTCNLHCEGCYADSTSAAVGLPWHVVDRLISEARELWGIPLVVFSGGEPLAYRSEGKGVLDLVQKHHDCLYLMFTNGTLIDETVARRLADLGNLTPAISVEGLQESTEARRGKGVFGRIIQAMSLLRLVGVPFGISVTATSSNCDEILSDRLLDLFFGEQAAFYGFIFHYMPIGRNTAFERMPSAAQRLRLWRRSWEVIEKRRIFLFDFWNSGPLVEGCISAGREGGYMYIDWDGKVMPCVFAPYSVADVRQVYAGGGTLNDVWTAPFFQALRDWQHRYGYGQAEPQREGNWLRPCPIRDHYPMFRELVERYGAVPEDEAARQALRDVAYYKALAAYGLDVAEFSQEVWEREYLGLR